MRVRDLLVMQRRELLAGSAAIGVMATCGISRAQPMRPVASLPSGLDGWPMRSLIQPDLKNSMATRVLAKTVQQSMLIDDMSTDKGWKLEGTGTLGYDSKFVRGGSRSLVFGTPDHDDAYIAKTRWPNGSFMAERGSGSVVAKLQFSKPQDWSRFNRMAIWVYVESADTYPHHLWLTMDDGKPIEQLLERTLVTELTSNQWNYVLWEIPDGSATGIQSISIMNRMNGRVGYVAPMTHYHFARIEMQRVDVEQTEGWEIQPGHIAFHHVGHLPHDRKIALIHDGEATDFEIVDDTGRVVYGGPVQSVKTFRGRFGVLDFSSLNTPGTYRIRAGAMTSQTFPIGDNVWVPTIAASLNTIYSRRCGVDMPGIHPPCHFDVLAAHNGEKRVVNGGWHDAADTHQNTNSTHQITLGMIEVYRRLPDTPENATLRAQILEEIAWGIEFSLRTRFGRGVRLVRTLTRYYGDNKVGNHDDTVMEAIFDPWYAAIGAYTLAEAAQLLAKVDPARAKRCREAAIEDYRAVFENKDNPPPVRPLDYASYDSVMENGSWKPIEVQSLGWAVLVSCAIHKLTGAPADAARAVAFGDKLMACQERGFDGSPVTGFFYESLDRKVPLDENLMATGESMLLALARLCQQFPDHERWMDWYSTGAIHADYFLTRGALVSAPYNHLPASLWTAQTIDNLATRLLKTLWPNAKQGDRPRPEDGPRAAGTPEWRESVFRRFRDQFQLAVSISDKHRVRTLPFATTNTFRTMFHGLSGTDANAVLASAGGLGAIAMLRGNAANEELLKQQLHWQIGLNPFAQSAVYGEGYDYRKHFASMCKVTVGSISTGFLGLPDDTPSWKASGGETWGICTGHFFHVLAAIATPVRVSGRAPSGAIFTDASGKEYPVRAGAYAISLPSGRYKVAFGGRVKDVTLVGGADVKLSLDPKSDIDAKLSSRVEASGDVALTARLEGTGKFGLRLRLFNASGEVRRQVALNGKGTTVDLPVKIVDANQPWGAALFVDGNPLPVAEIFGTASSIPDMPSVA